MPQVVAEFGWGSHPDFQNHPDYTSRKRNRPGDFRQGDENEADELIKLLLAE
jgi:hypothetical protein